MKPKQHISSCMTSNIQLLYSAKKKKKNLFFKSILVSLPAYQLHQNVTPAYLQAPPIIVPIILLNWDFKALK